MKTKLFLIAEYAFVTMFVALMLSIEPPQRAAGRIIPVDTVWAPAVDYISLDSPQIHDTDRLIKAREKASRAALKKIAELAERNRRDAAELQQLIAQKAIAKAADTLAALPAVDTAPEHYTAAGRAIRKVTGFHKPGKKVSTWQRFVNVFR